MKLLPLLLLAAVVVSGVGIFGFNAFGLRNKIFQKAEEGQEAIQGFTAAKTPAEAMKLFYTAIQERRYKTAAKYVVGNYGPQLTLAHDSASSVATVLDKIKAFTENKEFKSNNTTFLLQLLDPFPTNFVVQGEPKQEGATAKGFYFYETLPPPDPSIQRDMPRLDGAMFSNNLHPYGGQILSFPVELVAEGTGDAKQWKLNINISDPRAQGLGYFKDRHKRYVAAMEKFIGQVNTQRFESKAEYERELIKVFVEAK